MQNRKVYDYLAQVYFGKKETRQKDLVFKFLLSANLVLLIVLLFLLLNPPARFFFANFRRHLEPSGSYFEVRDSNFPIKFEYTFSSESPDVLTLNINLPGVNIGNFDYMRVVLKGGQDFSSDGILGVELKNVYNEKDYVYVYGIGRDWKNFDIPMSRFKNIADFSKIDAISFKIERWNAQADEGVFYIDKVVFLKKEGQT